MTFDFCKAALKSPDVEHSFPTRAMDEKKQVTVRLRKTKAVAEENAKLRTMLDAQIRQTQELAKRLQEHVKMYSVQMSVNFHTEEEAKAFVLFMQKAPQVVPAAAVPAPAMKEIEMKDAAQPLISDPDCDYYEWRCDTCQKVITSWNQYRLDPERSKAIQQIAEKNIREHKQTHAADKEAVFALGLRVKKAVENGEYKSPEEALADLEQGLRKIKDST
jgi:uncharacterized protein YecE (DUF72 family)